MAKTDLTLNECASSTLRVTNDLDGLYLWMIRKVI